MPTLTTQVTCPLHDSFRVRQISGLFDMPLQNNCSESFTADLPSLDEPWQIGLIVGPSASGKSTIARRAFPNQIYEPKDWPTNRAIIDCLGELPIKQITAALTSVGFSSPPSWIKPYQALSTGEKFRCDLARALLRDERGDQHEETKDTKSHEEAKSQEEDARPIQIPEVPISNPNSQLSNPKSEISNPKQNSSCSFVPSRLRGNPPVLPPVPPAVPPIVVFDEFTSVVDRTVARIGSAAIAKAIHSGRIPRRFVAVTCHYDIMHWLEPDWILDMSTGHLARGRLQRPKIRLEIHRAPRSMWQLFKRHHYLSANLHHSATCFVGYVDDSPPTFTAVLFHPHPTRPGWREHRTVCLPDFQGVGLGSAMSEFIAGVYRATNKPYFSTTSHPALIRHRARSPLWRTTRKPAMVTSHHGGLAAHSSVGRLTAGFEFVGPTRLEDAERLGVLTSSTRTKRAAKFAGD